MDLHGGIHNSEIQQPRAKRGKCSETRLHKPNPWVKKLQEEPRENLTWSQLGDNVPTKLEEKKSGGTFSLSIAPCNCNM